MYDMLCLRVTKGRSHAAVRFACSCLADLSEPQHGNTDAALARVAASTLLQHAKCDSALARRRYSSLNCQ